MQISVSRAPRVPISGLLPAIWGKPSVPVPIWMPSSVPGAGIIGLKMPSPWKKPSNFSAGNVQEIPHRLSDIDGSAHRASRRHSLCRWLRPAAGPVLYRGGDWEYPPRAVHLLFGRKILEWGKDLKYVGGFFRWCLEKGEKAGAKLESKAGSGLYIALLLFVGIPLPGTGAWSGTLAASLLNMDFKKSVLYVMLGVVLAGVIMLAASLGVFGAISFFK